MRLKQRNPGLPLLPTTQSFYFVFLGGLHCQSHKSCVIIYDCSWGLMCLADNYHNPLKKKWETQWVLKAATSWLARRLAEKCICERNRIHFCKMYKNHEFLRKNASRAPSAPKKLTLHTRNKQINNSFLVTKNLQTMSGVETAKQCNPLSGTHLIDEHKIVPNNDTLKGAHLRNFNQTNVHTECRSTNENVLDRFCRSIFFPFKKFQQICAATPRRAKRCMDKVYPCIVY